jgi:hypothetical protein
MMEKIFFCKSCNETGRNSESLKSGYFPENQLDYYRGYIDEVACNDISVCPYCNHNLIEAEISNADYILLSKVSNFNRQLLDAMVDLHKKDIVEYELKMSQFRNQYEQGQQAQKEESRSNSNIPKCPTCSSTNITRISATSRVINAGMFGLFGNKRKKTFHCNNCKYEW